MSNQRGARKLEATPGSLDDSLKRWKHIIRGLPEVRLDKVRDTRDALRRNSYEGERVLEETVRRLYDDVGALCRTDPKTGLI